MQIEYFGMKNLEKARKLQAECIDLHLACPPVVSFEIVVTNKENNIIRNIKSKSNSFVRNAYNSLSFYVSQCAANVVTNVNFLDGVISFKNISGTITKSIDGDSSLSQTYRTLRFGSGTVADTLNDYEMGTAISFSNSLSLDSSVSAWDLSERKIKTQITKSITNTDIISGTVSEVALLVGYSSSTLYMFLRDVFSPVTLNVGETLTLTYQLEVAFP